jgi:ligand-binding SRPBCC domain-containing protein
VSVSFECRTMVGAPVDTVFDLSLDVDAHVASMHRSGERAVAGVTSGPMRLGDQVTWKAKHFGIPFTMTSKIVELDRPHRFVDKQMQGPFRRFRHEHRFEPAGRGCVMTDRVEFEAPFGPVGRVVERLLLRSYMQKLIAQRNRHLAEAAESGGA